MKLCVQNTLTMDMGYMMHKVSDQNDYPTTFDLNNFSSDFDKPCSNEPYAINWFDYDGNNFQADFVTKKTFSPRNYFMVPIEAIKYCVTFDSDDYICSRYTIRFYNCNKILLGAFHVDHALQPKKMPILKKATYYQVIIGKSDIVNSQANMTLKKVYHNTFEISDVADSDDDDLDWEETSDVEYNAPENIDDDDDDNNSDEDDDYDVVVISEAEEDSNSDGSSDDENNSGAEDIDDDDDDDDNDDDDDIPLSQLQNRIRDDNADDNANDYPQSDDDDDVRIQNFDEDAQHDSGNDDHSGNCTLSELANETRKRFGDSVTFAPNIFNTPPNTPSEIDDDSNSTMVFYNLLRKSFNKGPSTSRNINSNARRCLNDEFLAAAKRDESSNASTVVFEFAENTTNECTNSNEISNDDEATTTNAADSTNESSHTYLGKRSHEEFDESSSPKKAC